TWGEKRFLLYYLVCVAGAGVCQLLVGTLLENPARTPVAPGRRGWHPQRRPRQHPVPARRPRRRRSTGRADGRRQS
ncbi:hypothetical protein BMR86_21435, partial [Stenotrophomonas sp. KAs 5-3]